MTEENRRAILVETVKSFGKREWFRDAVVHDAYPTTGTPTLEIKVNYVPIFERKIVMDFAQSVNLHPLFTIVDRNGRPVE